MANRLDLTMGGGAREDDKEMKKREGQKRKGRRKNGAGPGVRRAERSQAASIDSEMCIRCLGY